MVSLGATATGRGGDYALPPSSPTKLEVKKESIRHPSSRRSDPPSRRHSSGKRHRHAAGTKAEVPASRADHQKNPSRQMADGGRVKYYSKAELAKMPGMPEYRWGEEPIDGDLHLLDVPGRVSFPVRGPEWHPPPAAAQAHNHRSVPVSERIAHHSARAAARVNERIARVRGQHAAPSEVSFACVTARELERSQKRNSSRR